MKIFNSDLDLLHKQRMDYTIKLNNLYNSKINSNKNIDIKALKSREKNKSSQILRKTCISKLHLSLKNLREESLKPKKKPKKLKKKKIKKNSIIKQNFNNKEMFSYISKNKLDKSLKTSLSPSIKPKKAKIKFKKAKNNFNQIHKIVEFLNKDKNLNNQRSNLRNKIKIFQKNIDIKINIKHLYLRLNKNLNKIMPFSNKITDYKIGRIFGEGAYTTVKSGICLKTKHERAIKYYKKSDLINDNKYKILINEINFQKSINHSNIIKLLDYFHNEKYVILVMEYVGSSTLFDYLQLKIKISTNELIYIIKEISKCLIYLHDNNISHRDLKLENVLINKYNKIYLIDFGFSSNKLNISNYCGTPEYMSPEIIKKKSYNPIYADIWAFGTLIFKLSTGYFPFRAKNNKELFKMIIDSDIFFPENIDPGIKSLIKCMMVKDSIKRIKLSEILKFNFLNN